MSPSIVHQRLLDLLAAVPHRRVEHEAVTSAAHAAELRGTPPSIGGKALVLKLGGDFALLAVPGDARLSGRALRAALHTQRYRFATPDELLDLTGLSPGAVPPFGSPVFDLPLHVDAALAERPAIAFTLGMPTCSAIVSMADYLEIARPRSVVALTEPP